MQKLMNVRKTSLRGMTLTEAAIVLACSGIVLSAIWAAAGVVHENRRIEQASSQISMIADAVRTLYTGQVKAPAPTITGSSSSLACAGVFSRDTMVGTGTYACSSWTPTSPWGGTMGVGFRTSGGLVAGSFSVGFTGVPARSLSRRACVDLVSRLKASQATAAEAGFSTASAGGISLPVLLNVDSLDTAQGGGPLKAYVSDGSWHDVTNMNPTQIMKNYFTSSQCQGVAFAYAL